MGRSLNFMSCRNEDRRLMGVENCKMGLVGCMWQQMGIVCNVGGGAGKPE